MSVDPLLRVDSLEVVIRGGGTDPKTLVDGVSLTVEEGELLGKVYGIPSGVFEILVQRDGYITWRCSFGSIGKDDPLFTISG